ncbi:unnamed protein product [Didymodactylos carnosus]|uniref:BTB domain-containing protein n=1 Tax=Didymodactylos carnosus TaxID=1234261 RepID=A0A816BYS5_9BILA|nr:unnamed protein product [Didymodactylos carnosus]CAF4500194.1 unnamed protein product [Didymodactylos carnosus]
METVSDGDNQPQSLESTWKPLFEKFYKHMEAEIATLSKHLIESQTNLLNERTNLQNEIEHLKTQKELLFPMLTKYENIVNINIGGQIFSTTLQTLTKEECLFSAMFSGRIKIPEQNGTPFIDRDPTHFRIILNYLRTNVFVSPKTDQEVGELALEVEYYQIKSLLKLIRKQTPDGDKILVEKLLFHPIDHHFGVVISEDGLTATTRGGCDASLYAYTNVTWNKGVHYWEIILDTEPGLL